MGQAICKQAQIKDLQFELCYGPVYVLVKCCDKEIQVEHLDFNNSKALAWDLMQFDLDQPTAAAAALELGLVYDILVKEAGSSRVYEEYSLCLEFINGQCAGSYIVANHTGVYIRNIVNSKTGTTDETEHKISELKVLAIRDIEFNGLSVNLGAKIVSILTPEGHLTGAIDEITTMVKAIYGLKRENEFKFLLNQPHLKTKGYFSIGPWFDGKNLEIATESLYNPAWKKVSEYRLPGDVPNEKKTDTLKRILATVAAYKRPDLVTWILSYGLAANFAHYFRQKYGYFPHAIIIGRRQTGKTSLLALIQYLFWGSNPLPPIRPKTEAQLRQLLSQATLVIPIEDWRELESDSIGDMLSLLHSSSQTFVLRRVTTSNKDVNGLYLSLSSILADANYNQDVDTDTLDKLIFITLDKEQGIDVKKAESNGALLKNELRSDYHLHDVLHALGIELLQIFAGKLIDAQLAYNRTAFLLSIISLAYQSWLDLFRRYGIPLTGSVDGAKEFPFPNMETSVGEAEEDLELAFFNFVSEKKKNCEKAYGFIPTSKPDMMLCGFYEDGDEIVMNYAFLKEFAIWLEDKGFHKRGFDRLRNELGVVRTDINIDGKRYFLYKKHLPKNIGE